MLLLLGQGVSGPEEVWVYMARGILGVPCLEAQFSLAFKHQSQYIWFSLKIDEIKLWERVNIVLPPMLYKRAFLRKLTSILLHSYGGSSLLAILSFHLVLNTRGTEVFSFSFPQKMSSD